jgi:hypothetical protein
MRLLQFGFLVAVAAFLPQPADSQSLSPPQQLSYADLADLALTAPVAAHVRVTRASALRERDTSGVPAGHRRFYVEGEIAALIRGPSGMPAQLAWLVDLPNDARGRPARIQRRSEWLVLGQTVPGRAGELRLAAPDAQISFDPATGERLRAILREALAPDAPPRIAAIGRAFHVPGSLPGESETQIFLQTADNRPISLNVLRRPGQRPAWAVALSEMVDEAAAPPAPESLLWYRLACTLPGALPPAALRDAAPGEARAIEADYRFVLERLGPCVRTRPRR